MGAPAYYIHIFGRRLRPGYKYRSVAPKRHAYKLAGEPYGRNRKGLKRWLREVKAGDYFDERDAWLCFCSNFIEDGLHCSRCYAEPPWAVRVHGARVNATPMMMMTTASTLTPTTTTTRWKRRWASAAAAPIMKGACWPAPNTANSNARSGAE